MLRRPLLVAGAGAALVLGGAVPAFADDGWGAVDCAQNPHPGCELGAGKGDRATEAPRHAQPRKHPNADGGNSYGRKGGGKAAPRDPNLATCAYERSNYKPPPEVAPAIYPRSAGRQRSRAVQATFTRGLGAAGNAYAPQGDGGWYVYRCTKGGTRDAFYRPPVWMPDRDAGDAEAPVAPAPAPVDLARRAHAQLGLPDPKIATNPRGEQLVNLPTWLWLAGGDWRPVSATAAVPGVSVTATARPVKAVWSLGDGNSVVCRGPGTPYTGAVAAGRSSPDCGHTYRTSSADRPDRAFAISVTVHWRVAWKGGGQAGTFPDLTTASSEAVRVTESQALNTG